MTFLAPAYLDVAAAVAAGVVVLHFLSRRRPRPAPLPTARFVPDVPARAPSLANRPSDLLLLALRVLAVMAAGLALARPTVTPARRVIARVVVLDLSRATRSPVEARDSVRAVLSAGDTLLVLDSAFRGSLSAAFTSAVRAAAALKDRADSLELVVVSPLALEEFDAATDTIRALWKGRARIVRVAAADAPLPPRIEVRGDPDDPIRASVALLGARSGPAVRLVRAAPSAADSAFARAGAVLIVWPADPAALWPATTTDTIGAVAAGQTVVVATFIRNATLPLSHPPTLPPVVARWVDGVPAAFERSFESGCIRDVAIRLPVAGDLVLRRGMRDLLDVLAAPCGGPRDFVWAGDARIAALRGSGALMASQTLAGHGRRPSPASAWIIGVAALLLLIEMAARPRAEPA